MGSQLSSTPDSFSPKIEDKTLVPQSSNKENAEEAKWFLSMYKKVVEHAS